MSNEETREQIMQRLGITEEQVAEYLSHFPAAQASPMPRNDSAERATLSIAERIDDIVAKHWGQPTTGHQRMLVDELAALFTRNEKGGG